MRRWQRRTTPACLAVAVLTAASACAPRDLGPLPPRFSGAPLPADTVVSEMRSILAAEGIEVERRRPPLELGEGCLEQLSGRHAPETVDAALKAAFARARSQYGWQPGPDMGSGTLVLEKNNWTATVALPGTPAQGLQAPVGVSLVCVGADSAGAPSATGTPGRPAVGPS